MRQWTELCPKVHIVPRFMIYKYLQVSDRSSGSFSTRPCDFRTRRRLLVLSRSRLQLTNEASSTEEDRIKGRSDRRTGTGGRRNEVVAA